MKEGFGCEEGNSCSLTLARSMGCTTVDAMQAAVPPQMKGSAVAANELMAGISQTSQSGEAVLRGQREQGVVSHLVCPGQISGMI